MQANFQLNADDLGLPLLEKIKAMFAHQAIRISIVPDEMVEEAPQLKDLQSILEKLPRLGKEDADAFARDIEEARKMLNAEPFRDPWQS